MKGKPFRWLLAALAYGWLTASPVWANDDTPGVADIQRILRAVKKPGATVVVLSVWATWCDSCRKDLPMLLRFFRAHEKEGLRLVLVSADDEANHLAASRFLAALGVDFPTWMKRDSDLTFLNALDADWIGNLPALFLFDGKGILRHKVYGETDEGSLAQALRRLMTTRSISSKRTKR